MRDIQVSPEVHTFLKVPIGDLGDDDIIYTRLTNHRLGRAIHTLHKGNHKISSTEYPYPCHISCTKVDHPYVSWADKCFHCGQNTYDTVFVELSVEPGSTFNFQTFTPTTVDATVEKLKWTPLTSTFTQNASLPGPETSYHFYSADVNAHTSAARIEVVVSAGCKCFLMFLINIFFSCCS